MKIAIIPARGGSKRIPQKNIRDFLGKPIIAYAIEQALASKLFDNVIVSTDDKKIADVAMEYGADVPFYRPVELSDDYTGTNAVIKHAIEWFVNQGKKISMACCIYATAPFVSQRYLKEGYDKLVNSKKLFAFSVTSFPFPIQRALRITSKGDLDVFWPEYINARSQDLEEAYHDAGQFYWGWADSFVKDAVMYSNASIPIVLPRSLVQDIDTLEDWKTAELLYEVLRKREIQEGL